MMSEEQTGTDKQKRDRSVSIESEDDVNKKAKVAEKPVDNHNTNNKKNGNITRYSLAATLDFTFFTMASWGLHTF